MVRASLIFLQLFPNQTQRLSETVNNEKPNTVLYVYELARDDCSMGIAKLAARADVLAKDIIVDRDLI